jgi:hypothetical protein
MSYATCAYYMIPYVGQREVQEITGHALTAPLGPVREAFARQTFGLAAFVGGRP